MASCIMLFISEEKYDVPRMFLCSMYTKVLRNDYCFYYIKLFIFIHTYTIHFTDISINECKTTNFAFLERLYTMTMSPFHFPAKPFKEYYSRARHFFPANDL